MMFLFVSNPVVDVSLLSMALTMKLPQRHHRSITTSIHHYQPNKHDMKQLSVTQLYGSVDDTVSSQTDEQQQYPFAIVVQAEIVPERLDEFMKLIEHNAIQSRLEPECLRFDVIRSQGQNNLFFFYEIYTNNHSAMDYHKSQSHYQAWADFKASGGTISSTTYKTDGILLTE
jgi:quinol monooxygenase YgiN